MQSSHSKIQETSFNIHMIWLYPHHGCIQTLCIHIYNWSLAWKLNAKKFAKYAGSDGPPQGQVGLYIYAGNDHDGWYLYTTDM